MSAKKKKILKIIFTLKFNSLSPLFVFNAIKTEFAVVNSFRFTSAGCLVFLKESLGKELPLMTILEGIC